MTTCNAVREELVAYCDGELPEQERERVAAHLATCAACAQEEAHLYQIKHLLVQIEKSEQITPSPDFTATFWQRVEQEKKQIYAEAPSKQPVLESRFAQRWRELRETFTSWQLAPMLAAAASLLVFFSYLLTPSRIPTPTVTATPQPTASTIATKATPTVAPAGVTERLNFLLHYPIIADLDRLSHLEEIAAVDLSGESETELAKEEEIPPDLLQNPNFFAHYPMLKKMEQMQNLEAVLDTPTKENEHDHG